MSGDHPRWAETTILVSELPPSNQQNRAAVALISLVVIVFSAVMPISARPAAQLNAFFPSLDAIVLITDLITAVLLFSQFSIARAPSLAALAAGYLFTALIVIPHALTFAGAFSPTGLLGANNQTGSWLFIFWHFGFGAALLAYALLRRSESAGTRPEGSTRAVIGSTVGGAVLLVLGLTWLSTAGSEWLPEIITPQSTLSPMVRYPIVMTIAVTAAALGVLAASRRSVLDLWLMVVAAVFVLELVFSGLLPSVRFSVGFYAGRVLSLITSCIVLILLLKETMRLYTELARSNVMLTLERQNKLMTLESVAASISHELKQPLGSIALNCETAKLFVQDPHPKVIEIIDILEETIGATKRANDHLEGIRDLFGRSRQTQKVDLNEVVSGTRRLFAGELRVHGIVARVDLSPSSLTVYGHRGQIQQVLVNLMSNAVEAVTEAPIGSRTIALRTAATNDGMAVVEVEDSGLGLPPSVRQRVFEPFVTTKSGGMGLGLAICTTIIDRHGGLFTALAADPRGTIFRMSLPTVLQNVAHSFADKVNAEPFSSGKTALNAAPGS
jgi:signal transduction histidine kinase